MSDKKLITRGRDLSRLLSFLDLFHLPHSDKKVDYNDDSEAKIYGKKLNSFAQNFLDLALTDIRGSILKILKVEVKQNSDEHTLYLVQEGSSKPLTNGEINKLISTIEKLLDDEGKAAQEKKGEAIFSYANDMEKILTASISYLNHQISDFINGITEKLKDVKVVSIEPSGEEFMIQYEVSFAANYAEKSIAFPNPDILSDGHIEYLMEEYQFGRKSRGRMRRDIFFWVFDRTCHEVYHLLQGAAGQVDKNPRGWSAEHDASIGAYSLLFAISNDKSLKDLFPAGFVYEVLLKTYTDDMASRSKWTKEEEKEFLKWRDSFGLSAPDDKVMGDRNALVSSFCGAIGWEAFTTESKTLSSLLTVLFEDRTGDVSQVKIDVNKHKDLYRDISSLTSSSSSSSSTSSSS